jgi:hypothetical protein
VARVQARIDRTKVDAHGGVKEVDTQPIEEHLGYRRFVIKVEFAIRQFIVIEGVTAVIFHHCDRLPLKLHLPDVPAQRHAYRQNCQQQCPQPELKKGSQKRGTSNRHVIVVLWLSNSPWVAISYGIRQPAEI